MSKSITPEDGIVISRKWLEENYPLVLKQAMRYSAQPLKPVLEVAHDAGFTAGSDPNKVWTESCFEFLNNPIEISDTH